MANSMKCPRCGERIYKLMATTDAVVEINLKTKKEKLGWIIDIWEFKCPVCEEVIECDL